MKEVNDKMRRLINEQPDFTSSPDIETNLSGLISYLEKKERWTVDEVVFHSYLTSLCRVAGFGGRGNTSLRVRLLALGNREMSKKEVNSK
jgi:hypothetical protein